MDTVVFRIAAEPTLWHCGKYRDDVCTPSRPCGCGERRDFSFFTVPLLGKRYGGGGVVTVSQNLALVLMVNKGLLLIVRPVSIWRMALLGIGSLGLVK